MAETGKEGAVCLLRGKAELAPFFLQPYDGARGLFPRGEGLERGQVDGLYLFAQGGLGGLVLGFAGLARLEECLVALVDFGRRLAEAVPDFLAQFFCYRADLAPLVVKVLQAAVRGYDVFVGKQGLGFGKECLFVLKVFLEVIVAQFLVDFEVVGVVLAGLLEAFPYRCLLHGVYVAYGVELVLQLAVAGEGAVYVVGVFCQGVYFVDYGVLALEVGRFLGFLLCNPCSLFGTKTLDDECELVVGCRLCGLFAFGGRGRFMEHAVVLAQTAYVVRADFRGILGKERESLVHKAFVGVGLTLGGELGVFFALCHDFLDLYGGFRVGGGSYSFGL